MNGQPKVFIASSKEGLHVAEAVNIKLENDAKIKQWDNAFDLSSVTINSLISRANDTDFSIFVFHKDDKVIIKENVYDTVRDNVLFELGLFIGALGIERCYLLVPNSTQNKFRLPTDLAGVTFTMYDDSSTDIVDAVTASCAKIKIAIRKLIETKNGKNLTPENYEVKALQAQLSSAQSEIWRLKIDNERAQEEKQNLLSLVMANFYSVAKPATEAEILAWEEGAKKTYPKQPKIFPHNVYFIDRDIILPSNSGASSISVIVAEGVKVFCNDKYSSNSVYFMDGFRKIGH